MKKTVSVLLIILFTLIILLYFSNAKTTARVERILFDYLHLIQNEKYEDVEDLAFFKEENLWILELLPEMWENIQIIDISIDNITQVERGLFTSNITLDVYIKDLEIPYVMNISPYVAEINGVLKLIINARDIPNNFSYVPTLPEGYIPLDEIQFIE